MAGGAAVPIRVGDPATGCAGNRFAGQVVLTAQPAVTFGTNTVSHNAAVDSDGTGNTVVEANTVFGTLGCAGNNPAAHQCRPAQHRQRQDGTMRGAETHCRRRPAM